MTGGWLSERESEALRHVADILIPSADGMPSASDVGVHRDGVERVLAVQPALGRQLAPVIAACAASGSVSELREVAADHFQALCELVAGAYFTTPVVLDALEYPGRPARVLPDLAEQEQELRALTEPLVHQGPRWRDAGDAAN